MKYPIAIEVGSDSAAFGVVVPDLPGCFSAADSGLDEAIENAKEAVELWIETSIDAGQDIPKPSSIEHLRTRLEFAGWLWAIVEVDADLLDTEIERVNICLPKRALKVLDAKAKRANKNRSAYVAELALSA